METSVYHYDLDKLKPDVKQALIMELREIEKKEIKCDEGQSRWWPLEKVKGKMFASHGKYIDIVYRYLTNPTGIVGSLIQRGRLGKQTG